MFSGPNGELPPSLKIVVVDDEPAMAEQIGTIVGKIRGCSVDIFSDPTECLSRLTKMPADILITDIAMPSLDGMSLLREIKKNAPSTEVIIVTGCADKTLAIEALRSGAFDFFEKPVRREELVETVKRTVRYQSAVRERDRLAAQVTSLSVRDQLQWDVDALVGRSASLRKILSDIRLLHDSPATSVLVTGESGTGKELIARAIHFGGPRAARPFIPVNCATISSELAESTLFGHVKGSFTGAVGDRKGCFESANGGTIFLDEIGDMSQHLQVKLLRVIEDGIVVPIGQATGRDVDVRVIAATNANLKAAVDSRVFRLDLFYRLAGFVIEMPPLRERLDDIPLLAEHFVCVISSEMGRRAPAITPEAIALLMTHTFPGNVRELRNVIERAVMESRGMPIEPRHLHFQGFLDAVKRQSVREPVVQQEQLVEVPLNLEKAEHLLVKKAMALSDGNMAAAARRLGINRTSLYRRLSKIQD